jgi:hypothetical protein
MKLSMAARTEILANLLHEILDHMPDITERMNQKYKNRVAKALNDCGVEIDELTEADIQSVKEYFRE